MDISTFGPLKLVVIQPTSFCNLNCDYCYLPDRHLKNTLSLDLIEPIFHNILTSPFLGKEFTVCWHAGEPLAMPISFYEKAMDIIWKMQNRYDCFIYHSFQTNGVLINQAWCDLFKKYPVHVGVSIDGPEFIHDAHRKTRGGRGSHASTLRGLSLLQKNDIPTSAIAVITQDSLDYPDEIFNFFLENGIDDVGFNMEEVEGINQQSSLNKEGALELYHQFMTRFWELIGENPDKIKLREFEVICSLIYSNERIDYTDMNKPFVILSIDYQGNFCTFDPELLSVKSELYGDFVLGNIVKDRLESVGDTEKFKKIYQDMAAGVNRCKNTCDYFGVCGGGAGSNKYWENGTFNSSETMACRYRVKTITDLVLTQLENRLGLAPF